MYLLSADKMVTAKSVSFGYNGSSVGVVKEASIAAILLLMVMVSFCNVSFILKVIFVACKITLISMNTIVID